MTTITAKIKSNNLFKNFKKEINMSLWDIFSQIHYFETPKANTNFPQLLDKVKFNKKSDFKNTPVDVFLKKIVLSFKQPPPSPKPKKKKAKRTPPKKIYTKDINSEASLIKHLIFHMHIRNWFPILNEWDVIPNEPHYGKGDIVYKLKDCNAYAVVEFKYIDETKPDTHVDRLNKVKQQASHYGWIFKNYVMNGDEDSTVLAYYYTNQDFIFHNVPLVFNKEACGEHNLLEKLEEHYA